MDMEHWSSGWGTIENTMYNNEKSVYDLGPIGYGGQNGLWLTGGATPNNFNRGLELWKASRFN